MPVEDKTDKREYDDIGRDVDDEDVLIARAEREAETPATDEDHVSHGRKWRVAPVNDPVWYNHLRDGPTVDGIFRSLRPKLPPHWDCTQPLEFQINDADYVILNLVSGKFARHGGTLCMRLFGSTLDKYSVSLIVPCDFPRLNGTSDTFWPRFKVEMPRGWGDDQYLEFFRLLRDKVASSLSWTTKYRRQQAELKGIPLSKAEELEIAYLEACAERGDVLKKFEITYGNPWEPIQDFGYRAFMELYVCYPTVVRKVRDLVHAAYGTTEGKYPKKAWLTRELMGDGPEFHRYGGRSHGLRCFNISDFKYVFALAHNYGGEDMIRVEPRRYTPLSKQDRSTTCQMEFVCCPSAVKGLAGEKPPRVAPKLVMSNDIESIIPDSGEFPQPINDKICTSCYVICWHTPGDAAPTDFLVVKYQLGDTSEPLIQEVCDDTLTKKSGVNGKINKIITMHFRTERDMMIAESHMRTLVKADVYTGYNTDFFDLHYQTKRAESLRIDHVFSWYGRCRIKRSVTVDTSFQNRAGGLRTSRYTLMPGMVSMDMMRVVQSDFRYRNQSSFKLGAVSNAILGVTKVDLDVRDIPTYMLLRSTRKLILDYCHVDAILPLLMMIQVNAVMKNVQLCRGSGVSHSDLMTRGQTLRSNTMTLRMMFKLRAKYGHDEEGWRHKCYEMSYDPTPPQPYEGATVIKPDPGFYPDGVITLDYASLYPSVMRALNMDPATMIDKDVAARLKLEYEKDLEATSHEAAGGHICVARVAVMDPDCVGDNSVYRPYHDAETMGCFVHPNIREGVIPIILNDLAAMRSEAKTERDKYPKTHALYKYWEGVQNTVKEMTNSVYGYMKRVHWKIASSVCAEGKRMVALSSHVTSKEFRKENGYAGDARVVYGDTDSIMVKVWKLPIAEMLQLGLDMSAHANKFVRKPHSDEFEKCMLNFNLHAEKKRYEARMVTIAIDPTTQRKMFDEKGLPVPCFDPKIKMTGVESKRRNTAKFIARAINGFLDRRIMKDDEQGAIEFLRGNVRAAYARKLPWDNFIQSAAVTKKLKDYNATKTPPKQIVLAHKMAARDPGNAPKPGDRVSYIVTKSNAKVKVGDRVENPLYAYEHDMEVDVAYYVDSLKGIIESITMHGMYPPTLIADVFDPKNYVHRQVSTKAAVGTMWGVMGAERVTRCVSCGNVNKEVLCAECEPKRGDIQKAALQEMGTLYKERQEIKDKCTSCVKGTTPNAGVAEIEDMIMRCREETCETFWKWRAQWTDERMFGMGIGAVLDYTPPPCRPPASDAVNDSRKRIRLEYEEGM